MTLRDGLSRLDVLIALWWLMLNRVQHCISSPLFREARIALSKFFRKEYVGTNLAEFGTQALARAPLASHAEPAQTGT